MLYCPSCETPDAERTELDYLANDGTIGRVAGVACRTCGYICADPAAAYIPDGTRLELPAGTTAFEWFVERLRAAGCDPKPAD